MNAEIVKKQPIFEPLGEGLYLKGNRIYLRIQRKGRVTWLSSKTDDLPKARKWKKNWEGRQWMRENGLSPEETPPGKTEPPDESSGADGEAAAGEPSADQPLKRNVNFYLDEYIQAGHPIIKKRTIKRKAQRTVDNEKYVLNPVRAYFGERQPETLTPADFDVYHSWRCSGGYTAKFMLRGKEVTRATRGGDRAVDLELVVLSNALELGVRRGGLKSNPLANRGQYTDEAKVRHCREVAPTPAGLVMIVDWMVENDYQQDADLTEFLAYTALMIRKRHGGSLKINKMQRPLESHELAPQCRSKPFLARASVL
jgi:hypothetical protein